MFIDSVRVINNPIMSKNIDSDRYQTTVQEDLDTFVPIVMLVNAKYTRERYSEKADVA